MVQIPESIAPATSSPARGSMTHLLYAERHGLELDRELTFSRVITGHTANWMALLQVAPEQEGGRTLTQLSPADIDLAKIGDLLNCDLAASLKKH
jgi:hypothetical protein